MGGTTVSSLKPATVYVCPNRHIMVKKQNHFMHWLLWSIGKSNELVELVFLSDIVQIDRWLVVDSVASFLMYPLRAVEIPWPEHYSNKFHVYIMIFQDISPLVHITSFQLSFYLTPLLLSNFLQLTLFSKIDANAPVCHLNGNARFVFEAIL